VQELDRPIAHEALRHPISQALGSDQDRLVFGLSSDFLSPVGQAIVSQDDDEVVRRQVGNVVQGLVARAGGQGAVSHDRDDFVAVPL